MKPVRTVARALLASIFVAQGIKVVIHPDSKVETAKRVTDRVGPLIERVDPRLPSDARSLVRAKAASDVVAGLALATGRFTRPAAALLAANLVPTTVAAHQFWKFDPPQREMQQIQFFKNLGLLGGLLLAAADTEGKPSLSYRTSHAVDRSKRRVQRAARTAKREAKIAALARKLPG